LSEYSFGLVYFEGRAHCRNGVQLSEIFRLRQIGEFRLLCWSSNRFRACANVLWQ